MGTVMDRPRVSVGWVGRKTNELQVTQADIEAANAARNQSSYSSALHCPCVQALRRTLGLSHADRVRVGYERFEIHLAGEVGEHLGVVRGSADWQRDWVLGVPVEPGTFDLTWHPLLED